MTRITNEYSYEQHQQTTTDDELLILLLRPDGTILFNSEQFPLESAEDDILLSYQPPLPRKQ